MYMYVCTYGCRRTTIATIYSPRSPRFSEGLARGMDGSSVFMAFSWQVSLLTLFSWLIIIIIIIRPFEGILMHSMQFHRRLAHSHFLAS